MSTTVRSKPPRDRLREKVPTPSVPRAPGGVREWSRHHPAGQPARRHDPQWYKSAVIYELRVRSFFDGNGDGIGDLPGLRAKLGYLQDLGVNALWLLPFYPSPLKDDGYDISDYTAVHPDVGTIDDFRSFLDDAHQRGIRVITELVLNHTSDQHPWFQRARHAAAGDPFRDFYVWSDGPAPPARYADARIIFNDFEESNWTWDPVAGAWFWHRFFAHQPDLNYDNPAVVEAMIQAMDFWLQMGVDGLRLDAIPYLFEREGTNCENLPETHSAIQRIRAHVDAMYSDRMLLAEANQWPEDAAAYFGNGNECHMAFHFPIMPRLFMSLRMEDRFPVVDILEQTPPIPESCQWALFLRNHDELTLEMVTDEERDYMWRTHALDHRARINQGIRRRLAPLLGNSRRRLEVMNSLLFSLPGTPVIYYGDEIGMGDNMYLGDRNGVRTPMQWTSDRNAGFSPANPQALILPVVTDPEYHYQTVNVETQQANPNSLLWWTKRMIALRKQRPVFGSGAMKVLHPANPRVFAFVRELDGDAVLVVVNFSRFVQYFELDLSEYRGARPRELIGGACFPPIRSKPYPLTLGPHTFYWLSLSTVEPVGRHPSAKTSTLPVPWQEMTSDPGRRWLEDHLEAWLRRQPWAAEVHHGLRRIHIESAFSIPFGDKLAHAIVILVEPTQGFPIRYLVPLALAEGPFADALLSRFPNSIVVRAASEEEGSTGLVHDAMADREFCSALLALVDSGNGTCPGLSAQVFPAWMTAAGDRSAEPRFPIYRTDATVVDFGERFTLRLLHRVEAGTQPDEDIHSAAITGGVSLPVPELAAVLRFRSSSPRSESCTIATVTACLPNFGSAWQYTLDELARFFDAALGAGALDTVEQFGSVGILSGGSKPPDELVRCVGAFSGAVETMARRVAEWHLALGSLTHDTAFRPEPYTILYQRSLYQGIRSATARALLDLQQYPVHGSLASSGDVLARRRDLLAKLRLLIARRINASKIRIHGDMQLDHILYTGRDFAVAHCSGDPEKPLSQRALKRSPLRDVATMISSFHRVLAKTLLGELGASVRVEDLRVLRAWARAWLRHVVAAFVRTYTSSAAAGSFLPDDEQATLLLFAFLLEHHAVAVSRHIGTEPAEVDLAMDFILSLAR